MKFKSQLLWGLLLAALLLGIGVGGTAWAAEPPEAPERGFVLGRIAAIEGTSLKLETRQGELTVLTDGNTCFWQPQVENPTLADFEEGQIVLVLASPEEAEDGLKAAVVAQAPGKQPGKQPVRRGMRGQVTAIEDTTLVVNTPNGQEVRIVTDDQTRFRVPGVENPTIADVAVGSQLMVYGGRDEEGTLRAQAVVVIPADRLQQQMARGEVKAIEGTTLTVGAPKGQERTVLTDGETRFRIANVEEARLADIQVGDTILALGDPDQAGNLVAKVLAVVPEGENLRRYVLRGQVTATEDGTLVVSTPQGRGERRVTTDAQTYVRALGGEEITIGQVQVGNRVMVVGHPAQDDTLSAWVVIVAQGKPPA